MTAGSRDAPILVTPVGPDNSTRCRVVGEILT